MSDKHQGVAQKREYYLKIMQKAQQLNDQILIELVLKKLARLGMTSSVSTAGGCIIIPFPTMHYTAKSTENERPTWWTIFKLTLAIPGSLIALILLSHFRMAGPPIW